MDMREPRPLGAVHQGQGRDAGPHPHRRKRRGGSSQAVDKKRARLNCIAHLFKQIPYGEVRHEPAVLPERVRDPKYQREQITPEMYVPSQY